MRITLDGSRWSTQTSENEGYKHIGVALLLYVEYVMAAVDDY